MQQTILSIAGKPGLYKLVSRGKNNLIVEALDGTHRRQTAFGTTASLPWPTSRCSPMLMMCPSWMYWKA